MTAYRVMTVCTGDTGGGHHARQVTTDDVGSRNLVLAMTARHARGLRDLAERVQGDPVAR